MATPHKLTAIPYLQRWDDTTRVLSIRVLVVPAGNPLEPLVPGAPAFADASLSFAVSISDSADALPQRTSVDQVVELPGAVTPDARAIFTGLKQALEIPDGPAADTFAPQGRDMTRHLRKYLPVSYRQSFPFVRPRNALGVVDDTYHCLMKCPPVPQPPLPPMVVGWGEALAFALRVPRLAEALGLIHALDVPLDADPRLTGGGWLWVEPAAGSDYAGEAPGFLRAFATRVPALPTSGTRPIFTPVVIPVSDDAVAAGALGNFDHVMVEATRFDDGFAKIVHGRQPLTSDILDERGEGAPLGRDEGVLLGWDDEDVLAGQNRALGAPPDGEDPVLAPRGVLGYRVDVREADAAGWTSLSTVEAPLAVGVDLGVAVEERWNEVAPTEHSGQLWLPAWFLTWRGGSTVVSTTDEQRLMNVPPGRPETAVPVGVDVDLRYGHHYEFRVRLADTTGGGPALGTDVDLAGEAPVAALHMRRHRAPSAPVVQDVAPVPGGAPPVVRVLRPRLGHPEAVFAAGPPARAALLAVIAANDALVDPADAVPPTVADPDTDVLDVRVLVRLPAFDPRADEDGYVEWYRTTRPFPTDPDLPVDLELDWRDTADYRTVDVSAQLGADGAVTGPLTLATARDVRVEVRALGRDDLTYFASARARTGVAQVLDFHAVATTEADPVRDLAPADRVRSVFLRPDVPSGVSHAVLAQNEPTPALLGRLAAALDLVAHGPMLMGRAGERTAFGCSGLTHHVAPDASSVELADPAELAGQWVSGVQVVLDRDWTWRGGGSPTLVVTRVVSLPDVPGAPEETSQVGVVELMSGVNSQATHDPDRASTRFVFLDALAPRLGPDGFPYEVAVEYRATLRFEGGGSAEQTTGTLLPVVTRPRQVPEVVAAGIAVTPYERDAEYATTGSRVKRLWLEFAHPLADPRDAYFVRALTATPDPMLLPGAEPVADPVVVPGATLDPEPVRVITPGQVQDLSGLSTMQRLEPSPTSDRHFLVPLPPNTDPGSPELFSFYTYEIRVGHDRGPAADPLWSTAQARFGEPVVLEGVQHPAPELPCSAIAEPDGAIRVRAPYATPYLGLRRALPTPPNTEIWAVLYARVTQADARTKRNVQIDLRRLRPPRKPTATVPLTTEGETTWTAADVETAVLQAGLPANAPISALAVELLPEPNGPFLDPLGGDLGEVRVLRTSPLSSVDWGCC